jgi:hypothetical protein
MQEEIYIHINKNSNKFCYKDKAMTVFHRTDGPAVEYADGSKSWYVDGKLHRSDGPAVEHSDGYNAWYVDGKLHRSDGPAVEYSDGSKAWYVDDKSLTEKEFNALTRPIELTLEDIAAKFGVDVNNLKIVK